MSRFIPRRALSISVGEGQGGRGPKTQTKRRRGRRWRLKTLSRFLWRAVSFQLAVQSAVSLRAGCAAVTSRKRHSCAALSGTLDISDTTLPHKDRGKMYFTRHGRLFHSPGGMLKAPLLSAVLVYYTLCLSLDGVAPLFDF